MNTQELTAGDSLNFLVQGGEYPADQGWVLAYRLVPRTAGHQVREFAAVAEGADFRVALSGAATGAWAADSYTWVRWVDKAGERYTLETGQIVVKPNPTSLVAGFDGRSLARRTLDDLLAARAGWIASNGRIASYQIAGRTMTYRAAAEIDREIGFWQRQVDSEDTAARVAAGLPTGGRFYVRATR